jgi:molybdopterin-biosynthesis enzyme MoeA-like protein
MTQTDALASNGSTIASMAERTIVVEINQQQAEMLDRLIAEGGLGSTHGEVIHSGFARFCREHPDLLGPAGDEAARA